MSGNCDETRQSTESTVPSIDWGALSATVVWGGSAVAQKFLLSDFSPAALQCIRTCCASVLLVAILLLLGRRIHQALSTDFWPLLGTGVLMGIQLMSFLYALSLTSASEGALIISTAPVWTALLVATLGLEAICLRNWLGILTALGGVALIVLGSSSLAGQFTNSVAGDMIMVLAALLYGLFMVISKGLMQRHGTLMVIALCTCIANIVIVPLGLRQVLAGPWSTLGTIHWLCLAYVVLLGSVYAFLMWYRSIKLTSPAHTAVYQYLQPIVAVLAAAIFLHERLAIVQFVGIAVTLGGVYLARYPAKHSPHTT